MSLQSTNPDNKPIIDLRDNGLYINDTQVDFPLPRDELSEILGQKPRTMRDTLDWRNAWDDLGISADSTNVAYLRLHLRPDEKLQELLKISPTSMFQGTVLINGQQIDNQKADKITVNRYQISFPRIKGASQSYGITVMKNYDYKDAGDSAKALLVPPKAEGKVIPFKDLNFKLLAIEELMYNQEHLAPRFDIHEFADSYNKRSIDVDEEGYEIIPEALEYFKNLEIDESLAGKVKELYQDGGNETYMNIIPFWSGEDDTFDITSFDDLEHFPNLKKVTLIIVTPEIEKIFNARGIEVEQL